jgi:hypothetical protein
MWVQQGRCAARGRAVRRAPCCASAQKLFQFARMHVAQALAAPSGIHGRSLCLGLLATREAGGPMLRAGFAASSSMCMSLQLCSRLCWLLRVRGVW